MSKQKPSERCKAAGLTGLNEIEQVTGESAQTLINWSRNRKKTFDALILACLFIRQYKHTTKTLRDIKDTEEKPGEKK